MKLCKRKSDGTMFRPSTPDNYGEFEAMVDLFKGIHRFYFREVEFRPRKWYQFKGKWVDTGKVWEPSSGEFEVLDV